MVAQIFKKRKVEHPSHEAHVNGNDASDSRSLSASDSEEVEAVAPKMNGHSGNGFGQSRPNKPQTLAITSDVFTSDLFQIQVKELLSAVEPKYEKQTVAVEKVLRKLKSVIEELPSQEPLPAVDAQRILRKESSITIPFSQPNSISDLKYSLGYAKPQNVNVVGSFALQTAIKTTEPFVIDLAVTMPPMLLQDKDYLNYRYFNKRAYYIACMAAGIQNANDLKVNIEYGYQNSNRLQPIILIKPIIGSGEDDFSHSNCHIRVLIAIPSTTFLVAKTLPWKNCLRHTEPVVTGPQPTQNATPFYNATIRAESAVTSYLSLLHNNGKRSKEFLSACKLGRVWLRQRGYGTTVSKGGFGGFEVSCLLALLQQGGGPKGRPLLSPGYSGYQLFKVLLQFLASTDLVNTPLVIGQMDTEDVKKLLSRTPTLFDAARGLNVLWKMTAWSYMKLKHDSKTTLELLNRPTLDRFTPSFITKVANPLLQFDQLLSLPVLDLPRVSSSDLGSGNRLTQYCETLHRVLKTGLSDRVSLIHLTYEEYGSWKPSLLDSPHGAVENLTIGILINADEVDRAIDRGPSADDKEAAAAFRRFWGEKAELRRFKDGSIIESLVWTEKGQTHSILQQLVLYIVQRHISPEVAAGVQFIADKFSQLLLSDRRRGATSTSSHRPFLDAFEQLAKQMRELEGLPLSIRQISASCPALRYASILPSNNLSGGLSQPMDIIVQFEGSNRWPEDLGSVQRTKIAFLLKMGDLLEEASSDITTRLGLENEDQKLLNGSFLDIIISNGATFRLRINHELELTLLNRVLKDKSLDPHSREEAARSIAYYKRTFIQSPSHTQALRTLCTRFPFLSPSIRLLKQWCSSHLLSGHISEELIELLTIRTFVTPYPWTTPGSLRTAFLRTLTFISKWDWHSEPLIVDFSGAMTAAEIDVITTRFEAWRKIDPALNRTVLFAASNLDTEGITWTERGPSKVVAARLTTLARAACAVVQENSTSFNTKTLFTPSLADYDWVIHVKPRFTRDGLGEKKEVAVFKNLQTTNNHDTSLTGYDPLHLFLEELENIYGKNIVLFYNANSMAVIAGLWNPQAGLRSWKVNLTYSTIPIVPDKEGIGGEEGQVTINKPAILNDIARLGGDLIARIERKRVDF